ncbi:MAG: MoaD/ThiS family protein [Flavobacteriales bacterium]|nr:MoaD/ThiS family protein [Flavobacteriales bacterium]
MAKLIIPTPLRKFTNDQPAFESNGATVKEIINDLVTLHAGLKTHLLDEQGNLRSFVRVYVGDEDIQALQKEQTPVAANDTVSIIPAIAGGVSSY